MVSVREETERINQCQIQDFNQISRFYLQCLVLNTSEIMLHIIKWNLTGTNMWSSGYVWHEYIIHHSLIFNLECNLLSTEVTGNSIIPVIRLQWKNREMRSPSLLWFFQWRKSFLPSRLSLYFTCVVSPSSQCFLLLFYKLDYVISNIWFLPCNQATIQSSFWKAKQTELLESFCSTGSSLVNNIFCILSKVSRSFHNVTSA